MLDSRVSNLLTKLRTELEQAESNIGQAFHQLDLDGDGVVTHDELLGAMAELHVSKRPDAAAFQEMLDDIVRPGLADPQTVPSRVLGLSCARPLVLRPSRVGAGPHMVVGSTCGARTCAGGDRTSTKTARSASP